MREFFKPLKEATPWKIVILNLIASLAIFYAFYAPNIWVAWGVLLLSYFIVILLFLTFCYVRNNSRKNTN